MYRKPLSNGTSPEQSLSSNDRRSAAHLDDDVLSQLRLKFAGQGLSCYVIWRGEDLIHLWSGVLAVGSDTRFGTFEAI